MNLNLLDITIIVILAFYLISGMYRGFITSLLTTAGFVGAWFGAQRLYPKVAQLALSNQTLMAVLNQYLEPETFFETHTQAVSTVSEVIAGGESGPGYRPVDVRWVRSVRDTCLDAKVAFFFKQWGGRTPKSNGRELDGRLWDEMPVSMQA